MATWVNLMEVLWPVGSIYISAATTSPASTIGGSWTKINNSATLISASLEGEEYEGQASLGNYAGSAFISVEQLPEHRHKNLITKRILGHNDGTWNVLYDSTSETALSTAYTDYAGGQDSILTTMVSLCGEELRKIFNPRGDVAWLQH